jgi:hypothetical protein
MDLRLNNRLLGAAGALVAAASLAVTGLTAASAHTSAVSGTEHFQSMAASATATPVVIARGVFTDHGVSHPGAKVDTFVLQRGSFRLAHKVTSTIHHFNPMTCLDQLSLKGTYTLGHGTGKYTGISGSGTLVFSSLAILSRVSGKCSTTKPPVALQVILKESGPVSLP